MGRFKLKLLHLYDDVLYRGGCREEAGCIRAAFGVKWELSGIVGWCLALCVVHAVPKRVKFVHFWSVWCRSVVGLAGVTTLL